VHCVTDASLNPVGGSPGAVGIAGWRNADRKRMIQERAAGIQQALCLNEQSGQGGATRVGRRARKDQTAFQRARLCVRNLGRI
jgi:hypothetical protein